MSVCAYISMYSKWKPQWDTQHGFHGDQLLARGSLCQPWHVIEQVMLCGSLAAGVQSESLNTATETLQSGGGKKKLKRIKHQKRRPDLASNTSSAQVLSSDYNHKVVASLFCTSLHPLPVVFNSHCLITGISVHRALTDMNLGIVQSTNGSAENA